MPELPDVEVYKSYLDATALHKRVERVTVNDDQVLKMSRERFRRQLKGVRFESTRRIGKNLLVELDSGGWLNLHFGMDGRLKYYKDSGEPPQYARILFKFSNGYALGYISIRKLGKISFAESVNRFVEERALGSDALDLDEDRFKEIVKSHRGSLKSMLMNQRHIAGLGNVYADEILFQAKLPPSVKIGDLDDETLDKLYRTMRRVLKTAIDSKADPARFPDTYLTPHRSPGEACPCCSGHIEKTKVAQRSTYYCPKCQGS